MGQLTCILRLAATPHHPPSRRLVVKHDLIQSFHLPQLQRDLLVEQKYATFDRHEFEGLWSVQTGRIWEAYGKTGETHWGVLEMLLDKSVRNPNSSRLIRFFPPWLLWPNTHEKERKKRREEKKGVEFQPSISIKALSIPCFLMALKYLARNRSPKIPRHPIFNNLREKNKTIPTILTSRMGQVRSEIVPC